MAFEKEYALIWDIDGVVVDSPHEQSWKKVAEFPEWGIFGLTSEFYMNHVASRPRFEGGHNILEMLGGYEKHGAKTEGLRKILLERYCEQKNRMIQDLIARGEFRVFESSVAMLVEADRRNFLLGAASASRNANCMLSRIKVPTGKDATLGELFDVNVCGMTVPGGKAELFRMAGERLAGMSAGRAKRFLVFEDGVSGIRAAKENGMDTCAVVRIGTRDDFKRVGADVIVNDLSEVTLDNIGSVLFKKHCLEESPL